MACNVLVSALFEEADVRSENITKSDKLIYCSVLSPLNNYIDLLGVTLRSNGLQVFQDKRKKDHIDSCSYNGGRR